MTYFQHIAVLICIYAILSVSLNVIIGYTGLLNIGHAAFFGIGAYTSALLTLAGYPWWLGITMGAIVAAFFGLLIGIPCLRLKGDYFAIATLGFGEIIRAIMKNEVWLTRGPLGLPGIPKAQILGIKFSSTNEFLLLSFVIMVITFFIIRRIVKSPFGRVLNSIREDEIAAQALGKDITKYKVMATVIGSFFAGIAGSLYAHYITFIDPTTFTLMETILIVSMVILGGSGSVYGSFVGAAVLIILPEPLRFIGLPSSVAAALRQMMYGVILIILMLFRPQGLLGERRFMFKPKKHAKFEKV